MSAIERSRSRRRSPERGCDRPAGQDVRDTGGGRYALAGSLIAPLAIFVAFFAFRLPFRSEFLVNWDAVNFALGTEFFSLEHHQPHPPGYIGYVVIGRLLNWITGEANASLTLLSSLAGAAAPATLFVLARRFMSARHAVLTAVLFGVSPVLSYYSSVSLTYAVECALGLFVVLAAHRTLRDRSEDAFLVATLLLALLGAVRQSGAVFLLPVWVYAGLALPWPARRRGAVVFLLGNLAWFVPLVWLSGGPIAYTSELARLFGLAVTPTSLLSANPYGLLQNVAFTAGGLLAGLNVGWLVVALARRRGVRPFAALDVEVRWLLLLWVAPPLATYLFLHTGQLGYVLLILPAGFLWAGLALAGLARERADTRAVGRRPCLPAPGVATLAALFLMTNLFVFFVGAKGIYALVRPGESGALKDTMSGMYDSHPLLHVVDSADSEAVAARARQYDLQLNDAHWQELTSFIRIFHWRSAAVLAVADGAGSFRHLSYYLPRYRVFALGNDRSGSFGYLFRARRQRTDYSVEGLETVRSELLLAPNIRWLIIPDEIIHDRLEAGLQKRTAELEDGTSVVVVRVPRETVLRFDDTDGGRIRVRHASSTS